MPQIVIKTKFENGEYGWVCSDNRLMRVKIDHAHISFCSSGHHARDSRDEVGNAIMNIFRVSPPEKKEKEEGKPEIDYVVQMDCPGHPNDRHMAKIAEEHIFRNPEALLKHLHRGCESTYDLNISYNPNPQP